MGGRLPNNGEVRIVHRTDDGHLIDVVFQNSPAAVPLISIRRMAHRGCVASFWKGGGEIKFSSGVTIPIVEKMWVYFCKLRALPPETEGFQRQGA